jgi:ABC-type Na+ efflux pump permease subunit
VVTAKATVKATIAAVKAIIAAAKGMASLIAAGGWIAVVIIIVICMVAFIFASPYGVFSGGGANETPTIKEVIATVNSEWDTKIEQLKTDAGDVDETVITINGIVVISVRVQNWADVLSVYSVKTSMGDNPTDVAELDSNRISILKSVFNDMNTVTSKVKETTDKNNNTITKFTIEITSKNYNEMISKYNFNAEQQGILRELMSDGNMSMWRTITG